MIMPDVLCNIKAIFSKVHDFDYMCIWARKPHLHACPSEHGKGKQ